MSDIEDDMDPIQAMHTHGAMPDDGNDALFAVANLGFGVEAHPEGMEADVIEQVNQPPEPQKKRRRSHSLAHDAIKEEKLIYIHIDLETGGEAVGIIQMSAIAHDYTTNSRFGNSFNMYVKPPPHVKAKHWSSQAEAVTGLTHYCDKIKNAQSIVEVWKKFVEWCNNVVPDDKVGCLVAWNGKGSDMKWLWVVSEELHPTTCKMPTQLKYFMDPMSIIKKYSGCKLHTKHSGISGMSLASVYCHVTGEHTLDGAHDSLFDAQAQYKVVKDNRFRDYTDKAESLMDIEDVWRANHERVQAQKEEITRSVPIGWTEGLVNNPKIIDPDKDYKSHAGGGVYGPTSTAFAKTAGVVPRVATSLPLKCTRAKTIHQKDQPMRL
jgi:hypothetical protein